VSGRKHSKIKNVSLCYVSVQTLDIQGRVLQRINLTQGLGLLNTAGHLPNGMYLIRVSSSEGEVRTQKVLLQGYKE